jgi:hypothetical protein
MIINSLKNIRGKKMRKILISLVLMILLAGIVNASGIGVAPATLKFENALKGTTTEKEISIQNPGDEPIFASIEIEGELEEWIELSSTKVEVPAKGNTKIIVKLTPSEVGKYTSKIKVRAEAAGDIEGSGMGLLPGVDTSIVATITDQGIISGEVSKILTKDEVYGTPVTFTIGFSNTGNIPIGPKVKISIEKRGEGIIDTIETSLEEIKTGSDKDYEVKWQTTGKEKDVYYRANVIVSLNGEIIEEKEEVGFRILSEAIEEESKPIKLDFVGIAIILIIVVIGLVSYYVINKK